MSEAALEPGTVIDKYRVVRRIGEGGMATIYLASSVGPGGFEKPCALKLLRPDFSEGPEISDLLLREARLSALLHHPNIVQVFDLGQRGRDYYMTMEWVDGLSLSALLTSLTRVKRFVPVSLVAFVGSQVAEALDYLRRGVDLEGQTVSLVHRDVSPSNILLSNDGAVKLTDFGIVKVLEAPAVTKVGVIKGKYAYMSPEQIRGDPIDHRSDLFSLGVVLFEALTNRRLFSRKTLASTVAAVHAAKVLPPSVFNASVPPELDQVVLRALDRNTERRFETAEEMVHALEPFISSGPQRQLAELVALHKTLFVPKKGSPQPETRRGGPLALEVDDSPDVVPEMHDEEFAELAKLAEQESVEDGPSVTRELDIHDSQDVHPPPIPEITHRDALQMSSVDEAPPAPDAWSAWLPLLVLLATILATLVVWTVLDG